MSARDAAGQPFPEAVLLLVALAYAALCLAGLLLSWRLARRAFASSEARSSADEPAVSTPEGKDRDGQGRAGAYREPDPRAAPPRLVTGCLPRTDQLWAVAYLRDGIDAVRELIAARAFIEGLLTDCPPPHLLGMSLGVGAATVVQVRSADAVLSEFQSALGPYTKRTDDTVRRLTAATATRHLAKLEAEVVSSGLKLRHVPWIPISIVGGPSALPVTLGLLCLFGGAMPDAGALPWHVGFWAMIAVAIAAGIMIKGFLARTGTAATAYLRWLDTVRPSVHVTKGPPRAEDAALAMAVRGWKVLEGDPRLPWDFYSRFVEGPGPPS